MLLSPVTLTSLVSAQAAPTCGTINSPNGVCQTGTCALGQQCELAISCASPCISAGATSCYVCVNTTLVSLCRIVSQIQLIIGVLSLLLFIMGGILYSGSHLLSSAAQQKSTMQGWAIGLIIGAVILLVLYILAVPVIEFVASFFNYPVASCYLVLNPK